MACYADADQVGAANQIVGGIERNPARPGKVRFQPGVGGAWSGVCTAIGVKPWRVQIPGNKACSVAETSDGLDHQRCKITATSALQAQCLNWGLNAFLQANLVLHGVADVFRHRYQQFAGAAHPAVVRKLFRPSGDLGVGVVVIRT